MIRLLLILATTLGVTAVTTFFQSQGIYGGSVIGNYSHADYLCTLEASHLNCSTTHAFLGFSTRSVSQIVGNTQFISNTSVFSYLPIVGYWSGINATGSTINNCADWTSTCSTGRAGGKDSNGLLTHSLADVLCTDLLPIICICS